MKKLLLEVFITIHGIAAASGLLFRDNNLAIISDNSDYLYQYHIPTDSLHKMQLLDRDAAHELVPKKEKADFEAITFDKKELYVFGSGSGTKRNLLVKYNKQTGVADRIDMRPHYEQLQRRFGISADDFNIEGAILLKNQLWLFNRGNGSGKKNGIFALDKKTFQPISFTPVALPELQGVQTGFTDATIVDGTIYFIAAAEDSNSSYNDGEIKGTLIGRLDPKTKTVAFNTTLSDAHKFEGISLYKQTKGTLEFLLCEDQDNNSSLSTIYKVQIEK